MITLKLPQYKSSMSLWIYEYLYIKDRINKYLYTKERIISRININVKKMMCLFF